MSVPEQPTAPSIPWPGYVLAASGAFLFASNGIIIKLAYAEGVDAEPLIALRMAISLPFFIGIGVIGSRFARKEPPRLAPGIVLRASLIGMLGYWFSSYADFTGLIY